MDLAIWLSVVAVLAALFLLVTVAAAAARRARRLDAELAASNTALERLSAAVAGLETELDRQRRELALREEPAYVITDLGDRGSNSSALERRPAQIVLRPTLTERVAHSVELSLGRFLERPHDGSAIVRRMVDRGAVRIVAAGFGVARALRPEARDRVEFASRTEMRRSRRRREYETRLARRLVRSGHVAALRDDR